MNIDSMRAIKLAELVGIILGDGSINIYERHKRLQITMHSKDDLDYAYYIISLFEDLFEETPKLKFRKDEMTLDIQIFKRKVIYYFLDLGMKKSPKRGRAIVPKLFLDNDFSNYLLRGLFDTDGSLVVTNNNGTLYPRLELKICDSPMKNQIIFLLQDQGFRFGVYNVNDHQVRIQMNGKKQLKKWINLIGFSNRKHVDKIKKVAGEGFEPPTSGSLKI